MIFTVDAFEEDYAVLMDEHGKIHRVLHIELPCNCKEGDAVQKRDGRWYIDAETTQSRKKKINDLLARIINKEK